MAYSLGTRGDGGNSLVRNKKTFDARMAEIDFSKRAAGAGCKLVKAGGGKKTYRFVKEV